MVRCVTCHSEVADSIPACPACGSPVAVSTGTSATVAMEAPAAAAPSNGAKSSHTKSGLSRLSETSVDDGRFLPGTLVNGRYRIVGLLGRGGMGEVYRATDLTLAQPVALKFLPEAGVTERVLERFHAEVRIARQISHPNICRVYDIGEVDGQPFISMEYVDGEDLGGLLQRIGRLPADKALEIARKICAGLAAAHDRGVIHRDLKPQNIMLNRRGEPVIMDFGLAAVADQLTGAEARNGTPAYMSPEQLRGDEVTAKSDIYALGLVLYEIFSGRRAYEAKTIGDLLRLQEGAQPTSLTTLASDVDPQVEKVIKRCLSPLPEQRPSTPLAVAAALPGGDPLAAALAAGETPSPELVAASGKTEGMDLRYSIPLLAFVLAVVIGHPLWMASNGVLQQTPVVYSPAVAAHEARKIADSFGYTNAPRDTYIRTFISTSLNHWMSHDRKGKSWKDVIAAEPFFTYSYRESPALLTAPPYGFASSTNPASITAGMIQMDVNSAGQLREFEAILPEKPDSGTPGTPFNEATLFKAVGFQQANFTETTPERVPMVIADFRKAWKGIVPGLPDVEARIEAASLAGKLTSVRVIFPWTSARREPPKPLIPLALAGRLTRITLSALATLVALIFAVRNLRLNRGDRKGAFRFAAAVSLLVFLNWAGTAHHVTSVTEWDYLANAIGDAVFEGLMMWTVYLALEPAVRARWPHALVTWNRLLAGRLGDAQVGAHTLIGAAAGLFLMFGFVLIGWLDPAFHGMPFLNGSLGEAFGPLVWIGSRAETLHSAMEFGFILFFAIFLFRALLKNDYLAVLAVGLVFPVIDNPNVWYGPSPWIRVSFLIVLFAILAMVLMRLGAVASVVSIFFLNTMYRIIIDVHFSTWYAPYGLATIFLLVSIAVYAFWRSIGSRTLGVEETA